MARLPLETISARLTNDLMSAGIEHTILWIGPANDTFITLTGILWNIQNFDNKLLILKFLTIDSAIVIVRNSLHFLIVSVDYLRSWSIPLVHGHCLDSLPKFIFLLGPSLIFLV